MYGVGRETNKGRKRIFLHKIYIKSRGKQHGGQTQRWVNSTDNQVLDRRTPWVNSQDRIDRRTTAAHLLG